MINYKFGDIILVPFPFTDQTTSKKRPAVVVSSNTYHREHPDVIIMAITSQLRAFTKLGEKTVTFWKESGLLKPSTIKPVVATIENRLIIKKLGSLQGSDLEDLVEILQTILGTQ
jgi:mRNA interferase MazF